jgi:sugar phosphate isomerase/epimerase
MADAIQIGICMAPERVAQIAPGFDYVEVIVASVLTPLLGDEVFNAKLIDLASLVPHARACHSFVPAEVRLVGDDVDWEQVCIYVERAVRRAAMLGCRIIVFGSGDARSVPEDYSRTLAWGQLVRFLDKCADQGAVHGVTFAIEPLNRRESNILNTYLESVQLAKDVGRDEVRVLADIYHFMMEGEPLGDILQAPEWLAHVHLSDTGRRFPGSGDYPTERLFAILKEIDYRGSASVECLWGDDLTDESARALAFLRTLA